MYGFTIPTLTFCLDYYYYYLFITHKIVQSALHCNNKIMDDFLKEHVHELTPRARSSHVFSVV